MNKLEIKEIQQINNKMTKKKKIKKNRNQNKSKINQNCLKDVKLITIIQIMIWIKLKNK